MPQRILASLKSLVNKRKYLIELQFSLHECPKPSWHIFFNQFSLGINIVFWLTSQNLAHLDWKSEYFHQPIIKEDKNQILTIISWRVTLVFCCVIQDPRFSSIFIFSFSTSVQDTYCLLFRCICNPSQSISLNARLIKCSQDQHCCGYCQGWIKEYHPSSLSDWWLPSLLLHCFKNCYGSAVFTDTGFTFRESELPSFMQALHLLLHCRSWY